MLSLDKNKIFNSIQKSVQTILSDFGTADVLFCIGYILLILVEILTQTMFSSMIPPRFYTLCKLTALMLIGLKILLYDHFNFWQIVFCGFLVIDCVLIQQIAGYPAPTYFVLVLIGAKDIDFHKILKIYIVVIGSVVFCAYAASMLGVIVNLQYEPTGSSWHNIRNSFGIIYTTNFAAYIFFLLLAFFYLKGKDLKFYHYIGTLLFDAVIFYFCETRLDCLCIAVMVLVFAGINYFDHRKPTLRDKYRKKRDWLGALSPFFMPLSMLIAFIFTVAYNPANPAFAELNDLLSRRLSLGQAGLEEYGITLFGKAFRMFGNGGATNLTAEYFYLDSSCFYVLLQYGLLFFLALMVIFMYCGWKNKNDHYYATVLLLLSINCMIAHHMTNSSYDPFILAFLASMSGELMLPLPRFRLPHLFKPKMNKGNSAEAILHL